MLEPLNFLNNYYDDFFPETSKYNFYRTINNNDVNSFHEFMAVFMDNNKIADFIIKHGLKKTTQQLKTIIQDSIMIVCMDYVRHIDHVILVEILINDYDYKLTKKIISDNIAIVDEKLLFFSQNYLNTNDYISLVSQYLRCLCINKNLSEIQKFITNNDFNIQDLIAASDNSKFAGTILFAALCNDDTSVLKFLLENGIDFKKYESNILKICLYERKPAHLKILFEYGINLNLITSMDIDKEFQPKNIELAKFLVDKVDPLLGMLLMTIHA